MKFKGYILNMAVAFALGFGTMILALQPVSASITHWNRVPKMLKGDWETKKFLRSKHYHYIDLNASNRDFEMNNRSEKAYGDGLIVDSGWYGSYDSNHIDLAYQTLNKHRYYVWGAMQTSSGGYPKDDEYTAYGVVLSHNYKSMKVYNFKVRSKKNSVYFSHINYVGHFYHIDN